MAKTPDIRIGVDLGGTKIAVVALAPDGALLRREEAPTPKAYPDMIRAIARMAAPPPGATIGLGAPGFDGGTSGGGAAGLWTNSNITHMNGQPFTRDLTQALGAPVRFGNDANCVALAEAVDGAGAGLPVVYVLTLGTGLGGGLIIDGRMHEGPNRLAGDPGHIPLPWGRDDAAPVCFCGRAGCAETYLSGVGLARDITHVTGRPATDARAVFALMEAGDPDALAACARHADRLAGFMVQIAHLIDPDVMILAGGLAFATGQMDRLQAAITRHAPPGARLAVETARFGTLSGARGAAILGAQPDRA